MERGYVTAIPLGATIRKDGQSTVSDCLWLWPRAKKVIATMWPVVVVASHCPSSYKLVAKRMHLLQLNTLAEARLNMALKCATCDVTKIIH